MIRTSLQERNARGSAAETAARPPTRTKSSISVVTNNTLKKAPGPALTKAMQDWFHFERAARRGGRPRDQAFGAGNRFPDVTAQFRVTPRPKARRRGFQDDDS